MLPPPPKNNHWSDVSVSYNVSYQKVLPETNIRSSTPLWQHPHPTEPDVFPERGGSARLTGFQTSVYSTNNAYNVIETLGSAGYANDHLTANAPQPVNLPLSPSSTLRKRNRDEDCIDNDTMNVYDYKRRKLSIDGRGEAPCDYDFLRSRYCSLDDIHRANDQCISYAPQPPMVEASLPLTIRSKRLCPRDEDPIDTRNGVYLQHKRFRRNHQLYGEASRAALSSKLSYNDLIPDIDHKTSVPPAPQASFSQYFALGAPPGPMIAPRPDSSVHCQISPASLFYGNIPQPRQVVDYAPESGEDADLVDVDESIAWLTSFNRSSNLALSSNAEAYSVAAPVVSTMTVAIPANLTTFPSYQLQPSHEQHNYEAQNASTQDAILSGVDLGQHSRSTIHMSRTKHIASANVHTFMPLTKAASSVEPVQSTLNLASSSSEEITEAPRNPADSSTKQSNHVLREDKHPASYLWRRDGPSTFVCTYTGPAVDEPCTTSCTSQRRIDQHLQLHANDELSMQLCSEDRTAYNGLPEKLKEKIPVICDKPHECRFYQLTGNQWRTEAVIRPNNVLRKHCRAWHKPVQKGKQKADG